MIERLTLSPLGQGRKKVQFPPYQWWQLQTSELQHFFLKVVVHFFTDNKIFRQSEAHN